MRQFGLFKEFSNRGEQVGGVLAQPVDAFGIPDGGPEHRAQSVHHRHIPTAVADDDQAESLQRLGQYQAKLAVLTLEFSSVFLRSTDW